MDLEAPLSVESELARLRQLQKEGRHAEALDAAEQRSRDVPGNRDLLLLSAISLRHLSRIADALDVLARLEQTQPAFSLLHQERGLCHVARRNAQGATDALLRAVNLNPALPMSWRMLEGVYRIGGNSGDAATAAAHVATLQRLPAELVQATSRFFDGELGIAEQITRTYLLRHGDHPEAMRLLGKIAMARHVLDDAELLLESVLTLVPDHQAARHEYAQCLVLRHKYPQAREQLERLLDGEPGHPDYRALAATAAVGLGEHERAIGLYRDLLAELPGASDVQLWLGHALKTVGQTPEAVAAYRAAAALRPDFGDAYWSLANLKIFRFEPGEIARMRAEEASAGTATIDRVHLCFALGKALEDLGETAESWRYYQTGNALQRSESRYRPEILEINAAQQVQVGTRDFFAHRQGWGVPDRDPIFIVGLPRSGSTLIEQILASHSQVEGTQELANIQRIVLELQGRDPDLDAPRYPAILRDMGEDELSSLGRRYMDETRLYRTGRAFFVDKMPNNFRHVGLIRLMLPNARIIDARRDPMSCCFSNLKQLFAHGQEFSYSIDDIARYYRLYLDLMQHWDEALPGQVLRVQLDDVVADLEGSVRRILAYCDLAFEPACVNFHENRRSVRTPSSEQVRRPIFRDGLEQWRPFEPWLAPLRDALGDALVRYRG